MNRRQWEEEPERYLFIVDAILRNHEFSLEEVKFLRQINLEGFVVRITWEVLHETLNREALSNPQEETMMTTLQEKTIPLITADLSTQLWEIFELTNRKGKVSTQWKISKLFPSLKIAPERQQTVKVIDCTYPGAKRPLRILSSSFCLNTAGQNHISISFAELILAALNGQAVDCLRRSIMNYGKSLWNSTRNIPSIRWRWNEPLSAHTLPSWSKPREPWTYNKKSKQASIRPYHSPQLNTTVSPKNKDTPRHHSPTNPT